MFDIDFNLNSDELELSNILIDEVKQYIENYIENSKSVIFGICGDLIYLNNRDVKFEIFHEDYNITWLELSNIGRLK